MKPGHSTVLSLTAFFLIAGSLSYSQPRMASGYATLQVELKQILDDLGWVEQQLAPIREAAESHERVISHQAVCKEKTAGAMLRLAPEQETSIRRWIRFAMEAQASPERHSSRDRQSLRYRELLTEFDQLKNALSPVLEEALHDPAVRECRSELRQIEYEAMLEIDPRAETWLLRERALNEAFRRLQEKAEESR